MNIVLVKRSVRVRFPLSKSNTFQWTPENRELRMGNSESLKPSLLTGHGRTETQAWRHAEIHEHGLVIKRLTEGNPHGCMAGIFQAEAGSKNNDMEKEDREKRRKRTLLKQEKRLALMRALGMQGGMLYEKHRKKVRRSGGYIPRWRPSIFVAVTTFDCCQAFSVLGLIPPHMIRFSYLSLTSSDTRLNYGK